MDLTFWTAFVTVLVCDLCQHCSKAEPPQFPRMDEKPLFDFAQQFYQEMDSMNSSVRVNLGFNMSYYGSLYSSLIISRDGVISLGDEVKNLHRKTWLSGVLASEDQPFIAPCIHKGRIRTTGYSYNGTVYYSVLDAASVKDEKDSDLNIIGYLNEYVKKSVINTPSSFKANWLIVVTWSSVTDSAPDMVFSTPRTAKTSTETTKTIPLNGKTATFQAVIVTNGDETFAIFNYQQVGLSGQASYLAGFNGGFGRGWTDLIPCRGTCTKRGNPLRVKDLPSLKGSDYNGRFIFNIGRERLIRGGCLSSELVGGVLELYPYRVGMFGGEMLRVSGGCLFEARTIYCKYGEEPSSVVTEGMMVTDMQGFCPVPILTRRGPVLVSWSSDNKNWTATNFIFSVLPSRMEPTVDIAASVKENWYSRDATNITVKWTPRTFSHNSTIRVEVKLLGYREDEANNQVEFKVLEKLGEADNSVGSLTTQIAEHRCRNHCEDFELGLLEIGLIKGSYDQATDRVALRFGPIPLGWYVNHNLTSTHGPDWSDQKCKAWNQQDGKDTKWLDRLLQCPCNLDQALADFGRWQTDPGCNLFAGSVCYYHKNAKHCVRSVVPTSDGSGNQCCYNHDGTLRYSELSYQGSTPDRGHAWGAAPYDKPNLVPDMSHWRHDVVSFYYCCLWNDYKLCDLYMELRPTTDCSKYDVPYLALIRGESHMTTFSGQEYNFEGMGDFWLINSPEVKLQGRFMTLRDIPDMEQETGATALMCLAIKGQGQTVQVCPAPKNAIQTRGVDVRIGKDRTFFLTKSSMWQDFNNQAVVNNAKEDSVNQHDNFTILLTNNIGVKVTHANGLLHATVALPPTMKASSEGLGLLGRNTDEVSGGYVSRSGSLVASNSDGRTIYETFALSWNVTSEDSLFSAHYKARGVDDHKPYFNISDIPLPSKDITLDDIYQLCGEDSNCEWDYKVTENPNIARTTKAEDELFNYLQDSANRVDNCGLPDVGRMAIMNGNNFSVGLTVEVMGCRRGNKFTEQLTLQCVRDVVTPSLLRDTNDAVRRLDKKGQDYVIHWVPRPSQVCFAEDDQNGSGGDDDNDDVVIAVVVCIVLIILIAFVIVGVIFVRRKQSARNQREQPLHPL